MKLLKYALWSIIIAFIIQLIAGMYIVIWDSSLIGENFAKIWITLGISSFFALLTLSIIDKKIEP